MHLTQTAAWTRINTCPRATNWRNLNPVLTVLSLGYLLLCQGRKFFVRKINRNQHALPQTGISVFLEGRGNWS